MTGMHMSVNTGTADFFPPPLGHVSGTSRQPLALQPIPRQRGLVLPLVRTDGDCPLKVPRVDRSQLPAKGVFL